MKHPLLYYVANTHSSNDGKNGDNIDVESAGDRIIVSNAFISIISNSPSRSRRASSEASSTESQKQPFASRLRQFSHEVFVCQICLENVDCREAYTFTGNGQCSHQFCRLCLRSYLVNRITDSQVRNPCPMIGRDGCTTEACLADVQELCPWMIRKFERFTLLKSDSSYRDCPKCNLLQKCDASNPITTCEQCKYQFCFYHSDSHPAMSCSQYARSIRVVDWASRWKIFKSTKSCPSCKAPIEKMGGCNHITCKSCSANWCWLCKQQFETSYDHFGGVGLFNCPGGQFAPDTFSFLIPIYRVLVIVIFAVEIPILIVLLPFHVCLKHICKLSCCKYTSISDVVMFVTSTIFVCIAAIIGVSVVVVWFFVALPLLPLTCPIACIIACRYGEEGDDKCTEASRSVVSCLCYPIYTITLEDD